MTGTTTGLDIAKQVFQGEGMDEQGADERGNIFATGPGGIWVFSPAGKHLGTIKTPQVPANCNWVMTGSRSSSPHVPA